MGYKEFISYVEKKISEQLSDDMEVKIQSVVKNNGVSMDGISVMQKGLNIAPTIYLESYYLEYVNGKPLPSIIKEIMKCYEGNRLDENFDVNYFTDYKKIRTSIVYKLINYEKNSSLLEEIPHLPFLDMAIVFYCLINDEQIGDATILVHNSHIDMWGISHSTLYEDAKKNSIQLLGAELKSMSEVLFDLTNSSLDEDLDFPMYVLTNTRKMLGAACILYDGILEQCGKRIGKDYYLLPSSIHEMILMPVAAPECRENLKEMVRDINATQVKDTEVLSDNIYYYSLTSKSISVV